VWVRDGESLRPIDVSVGLTDGVVTEISGAGIDDGVEVVTGEVRTEAVGPTSPVAPQRSRGAGGAGGAGGGRGQ
jgi:hypothetical protein